MSERTEQKWLPVAVRLRGNKKMRRLGTGDKGDAKRWRHVAILLWCREEDNAGRVLTVEAAIEWGLSEGRAQALIDEYVQVGLWDLNGGVGSYVIHDWDTWNGAFDERRRKDAEYQRNKRAKQREESDASS